MSTTHNLPYRYAYERPAVTTDAAVFALIGHRLHLLLVERGTEPFKGKWALPGGFLQPHEDLDACARRELVEETGVDLTELAPFGTFSAPDRDPRGWVVSAGYMALTPSEGLTPKASTDAAAAQWFPVDSLPALAFDHDTIVERALAALKSRCEAYQPLFALLTPTFTLSSFQAAYEAVMGTPVDRRNLLKGLLASGLVEETGEVARGKHRPARLYRPVQSH